MLDTNLTKEQRAEMLEKAKETKRQKDELAATRKHDWVDRPLWEYLYSYVGGRMPMRNAHCSETKHVKRALKLVDKDYEWWQENFDRNFQLWAEKNPKCPAYVMGGLVLEAALPDVVNNWRKHDV